MFSLRERPRAQQRCVLTVLTFCMLALSLAVPLAVPLAHAQETSAARVAGQRVEVPIELLRVGDGDTVIINWSETDHERVRILGIDTPETRNPEHNLPYAQSFGEEARAFALGVFATAEKVEILRAAEGDRYGRTLGYLFVNGRNYSAMVVRARLAAESVSHYGDNGFPEEAAEVLAAAEKAGPLPFEAPYKYRQRMREVTEWMQANGLLRD